jgi:putative OPT family oligopeptide transporter
MSDFKPYIDPQKKLPETTFKAVILGILLSALLASANAFLGLFAGMTVSASIPAAVMSMAIFRLFKKQNILENNAVQTAASAGESLAAGVIFTFPALLLMGYWTEFNYLETFSISICGGILGVLFTIPLRSALIIKQKLKFPEGIATSEVLKSGQKADKSTKFLFIGGILGLVIKMLDSGFKLWHSVLDKAILLKQKTYLYFGMNLSPALIGVGYIVGINISLLVFLGGVLSWWVAIPLYIANTGNPEGLDAVKLGYEVWSSQIRYLGVGGMVVGGLWALINIRKSIVAALKEGISAIKNATPQHKAIRTEINLPMKKVAVVIVLMLIPIMFIYFKETGLLGISTLMAFLMVIAGFLFSAVAAYMGGLVGSSNNPISGVTIATILSTALILLLFLGTGSEKGPAAAVLIGAVVCCAASIGGDNMQDLKAGYLLGATPKRQQIMQIIGVVSAAIVLPLVLDLLNAAYGIGPKTPNNPNSLTAPQATLMQGVAQGVFGKGLPWNMVFIGMGMAVVIIIIDKIQEARGAAFRLPVLAVAIGLYLPFELDSAIMLGGLIAWISDRHKKRRMKQLNIEKTNERSGVLLASGLITGEALMGIFLAIPIVIFGSPDFMAILNEPGNSTWGLLALIPVVYLMYRAGKQFNKKQ